MTEDREEKIEITKEQLIRALNKTFRREVLCSEVWHAGYDKSRPAEYYSRQEYLARALGFKS